ncbi:MAG: BrnT family toxin [Tagaea sp.]|nr:BrnT family toxin [Tagaea sp.]
MFDWRRIDGFDWDDGNRVKSARKHGVTASEAEQVFFNRPLIVADDTRHSDAEPRFHALGRGDDGRLLHVTFTLRRSATLLRVISARAMNRKERAIYERTP